MLREDSRTRYWRFKELVSVDQEASSSPDIQRSDPRAPPELRTVKQSDKVASPEPSHQPSETNARYCTAKSGRLTGILNFCDLSRRDRRTPCFPPTAKRSLTDNPFLSQVNNTSMSVPRLPLPGTLEIPRHYDFAQTGSYTWGPTIISLVEANPEDMATEASGSSKGQRSRLACLRCRVKKTKCDGNTPCNQCIKTVQDCSYEERRKPELSERALTEKLAILQSRYDALTPSTSGMGSGSIGSPSSSSSRSAGTKASWTPGKLPRIEANVTPDIRNTLLKIALTYLPRCNFDIDPAAIFDGLKLPDAQQPHPAFLNALMLLGTFYAINSPTDPLPVDCPPPEYFVQEIRAHMANALSDVDRLTHYISASIMLSYWLLQNGRFLEGQYEICSTARLAIDCNLHQLDEQTVKAVMRPGSVPMPPRQASCILGPPSSLQDLEMRVGIFWGIYLGDKNAALMTGLPAAFDERTANPDLQITTVFPKRTGHFSDAWSDSDYASLDDLMGYPQIPSAIPRSFRNVPSPATVVSASAQGMTLLLRGIRLSCVTPQTLEEARELRNGLITLNQAISRFTSQLPRDVTIDAIQSKPPPYAFGTFYPPMAYFCLSEIRCSAYVIIIRMHQAAEQLHNFQGGVHGLAADLGMGEDKKMAAAHATARIAEEVITELNRPGNDFTVKDGLCVIMGYLWAIVAVTFVERMTKLRQAGQIASEYQLCTKNLTVVLNGIRRMSQEFVVLDLQVQKIENMIKDNLGSL